MSAKRDIDARKEASNPNANSDLLRSCYDNSWAVVIGINEYANVPALEYAVADAELVASTLASLDFPAENITALLNRDATRQNIADAISVNLVRNAGPNDRVLVFFAGHGRDYQAASGRKMGFFIPQDGDRNYLASRCIAMRDVELWSEMIPAKHVLFVMDCCYSGLAATRSAGLDPAHRNYLHEITQRSVRQIITAGRADQKVVEDSGHGIFTRAFVRGLAGAADLNGRGFVTGFDLGHYLESRVFEESRWQQQPMFRYLSGDGEFIVSTNLRHNRDQSPRTNLQQEIKSEAPRPRPKMNQPMVEWWVVIDGEESGPLDEGAIRKGIHDGLILRDTKCWREGMSGWQSLDYMDAWASAFPPLPPPPIPESANKSGKEKHRKESVDPTEVALHESIDFDIQECERAITKGQGSKDYIKKVYQERLEDWKRAAILGWPEGQWLFGCCYEKGLGVPKQTSKAVQWYRMAAEQGYTRAQFNLGVCYDFGEGVSEDKSEAVKWYRKAAEQGYADAQYDLGLCYDKGIGVRRDKSEAIMWYRKAAERGHASAQNNLGVCYEKGIGMRKDKSEAVKWYRKAGEQGHYLAQHNLGDCYKYGIGVRKDKSEAAKWYRNPIETTDEKTKELIKKKRNRETQFSIGLLLIDFLKTSLQALIYVSPGFTIMFIFSILGYPTIGIFALVTVMYPSYKFAWRVTSVMDNYDDKKDHWIH